MEFTVQAKEAIEKAFEAAKKQHMKYVGTEHLLLGVAQVEESVAGKSLKHCDVTPDKIENMIKTHGAGDVMERKRGKQELTSSAEYILEAPESSD